MKKYEKPTLKVVQIRVQEDIANTTYYDLEGGEYGLGMLNLMATS